jgi:hypothetical protein
MTTQRQIITDYCIDEFFKRRIKPNFILYCGTYQLNNYEESAGKDIHCFINIMKYSNYSGDRSTFEYKDSMNCYIESLNISYEYFLELNKKEIIRVFGPDLKILAVFQPKDFEKYAMIV